MPLRFRTLAVRNAFGLAQVLVEAADRFDPSVRHLQAMRDVKMWLGSPVSMKRSARMSTPF